MRELFIKYIFDLIEIDNGIINFIPNEIFCSDQIDKEKLNELIEKLCKKDFKSTDEKHLNAVANAFKCFGKRAQRKLVKNNTFMIKYIDFDFDDNDYINLLIHDLNIYKLIPNNHMTNQIYGFYKRRVEQKEKLMCIECGKINRLKRKLNFLIDKLRYFKTKKTDDLAIPIDNEIKRYENTYNNLCQNCNDLKNGDLKYVIPNLDSLISIAIKQIESVSIREKMRMRKENSENRIFDGEKSILNKQLCKILMEL